MWWAGGSGDKFDQMNQEADSRGKVMHVEKIGRRINEKGKAKKGKAWILDIALLTGG